MPHGVEVEITDELIAHAADAAGRGLTMPQIALALGMGERTLYEKKKRFPELAAAIDKGRMVGLLNVTNALYNSAVISKNVVAQIFYLKNRDHENWKDRRDHEHIIPASDSPESVSKSAAWVGDMLGGRPDSKTEVSGEDGSVLPDPVPPESTRH